MPEEIHGPVAFIILFWNPIGDDERLCNGYSGLEDCIDEPRKPAGGNDGVIVQEDHQRAKRLPDTEIIAACKSKVYTIPDEADSGKPFRYEIRAPVGGTVVDQDNFKRVVVLL